ncbi:PAS domain-containing protein [Methylobacterium sp. J-026]|uniref:PAS domain-containing protein n=1 Tax=Methylobacterium sp. J-026 TaxID=2836624 RepID=UPI001FBC0777|nr:PAS domain-containing protein [Methylobacterium sp. J-026]MCJ2138307.1 PAS domain-containing protein [Methylobacterium sp. J-026]
MPKLKSLDGPSRRKEFQVPLDARDGVGTWTWDAASDRVWADGSAARLFNLGPEEAEAGLPLSAYAAAVPTLDRARIRAAFRKYVRDGGPAVVEYRVSSAGGALRWVLLRGRFSSDHLGRPVRGHGIIVDVTDLNARDGDANPVADPGETPLERAADAAISAFRAVDALNDPGLRAWAEALLHEIGRKLAAQQAAESRANLN